MALKLRRVESKETLNVSQDYMTSPAQDISDSQGAAVQTSAGSLTQDSGTEVVEESYEFSKVRLRANKPESAEEYGEDHHVTPRKGTQTVPLKTAHEPSPQSVPSSTDVANAYQRPKAKRAVLGARPVSSAFQWLGTNTAIVTAAERVVMQALDTSTSSRKFAHTDSSEKSAVSAVFSQKGGTTSQTEAMTSAAKNTKLRVTQMMPGGALAQLKARRSEGISQVERDVSVSAALDFAQDAAAGHSASASKDNLDATNERDQPVKTAKPPRRSTIDQNGLAAANSKELTDNAQAQTIESYKRKPEADLDVASGSDIKRRKPCNSTLTAAHPPKPALSAPASQRNADCAESGDKLPLPRSSPRPAANRSVTVVSAGNNRGNDADSIAKTARSRVKQAARTSAPNVPPARSKQRQPLRLLRKNEESDSPEADAGAAHNDEREDDRVVKQRHTAHSGVEQHQKHAIQADLDEESQPVLERHRRSTPKEFKIGNAEPEILVISDHVESSPGPDGLPTQMSQLEAAPDSTRALFPKTPVAVKPNLRAQDDDIDNDDIDDNELFDQAARSSRKANIISFSKSGPRNQGVPKSRTSGRTPGRSSMASTKARSARGTELKKHDQRTLRSVKRAVREFHTDEPEEKTRQASRLSNTAESVSQAIGELYRKSTTRDTGTAMEPLPHYQLLSIGHYEDADEQHQVQVWPVTSKRAASDKMAVPVRSPAIENSRTRSPSHKQPTILEKSLKISAGRDGAEKRGDTSYATDELSYEGDTLVDDSGYVAEKVIKRIEMPPDGKFDPPSVLEATALRQHELETGSLCPQTVSPAQTAPAAVIEAVNPKTKRSLAADEDASVQAEKRVKVVTAISGDEVALPEGTKTDAGSVSLHRPLPRGKRMATRPVRKPSQSSQKVDMLGSPVPIGADMRNTLQTILEVVSRREAKLDRDPDDVTSTRQREYTRYGDEPEDDTDPDVDDAYAAPPSRQPEKAHIISSNTKKAPASPEAPSTAFTKLRTSSEFSGQVLENQMYIGTIEDPFTRKNHQAAPAPLPSASLRQVSRPAERHNSKRRPQDPVLSDQDQLYGAVSHPRQKASAAQADLSATKTSEVPNLLVMGRPSNIPSKAYNPHPASRGNTSTRNLSRRIDEFQDNAAAVATEEDSIQKRLSAHSAEGQQMAERVIHGTDRGNADVGEGANRPLDMDKWIPSLQARQLNLVNMMVECVQRLTQYMFEQERGTEEMIAEYHRRNVYLIEQEEKRQVQIYHQMRKDLGKRKKAKLSEGYEYLRGLELEYAGFEHEKQRHEKRKAAWEIVDAELEAFIVEHS